MKRIISLSMKQYFVSAATVVAFAVFPTLAVASTLNTGGGATGTEFTAFYNFVYGAATGYLGRSIAIVGGLIGLGMGAGTGRALPAIIGVFLAVFGVLGPTIVNALFTSTII